MAGHPKLAATAIDQRENVMLAMNLPKKVLPSDGFVSLVWITAAIDPSEFYVLPSSGWKCLCRQQGLEKEGDQSSSSSSSRFSETIQVPASGFEVLDRLMTSMKGYYALPRHQSGSYSTGELVAVRLTVESSNGDFKESSTSESRKTTMMMMSWFRAVVLEDAVGDGSDSDEAPIVSMKLLDFGMEVRKSAVDVFCLPKRFAYVGPMVLNE
jgi:hypothetical protein